MSLLYAVINCDNNCFEGCGSTTASLCFTNEYSFITHVLKQYNLPSLSNLIASDIGKEQWKLLCKKAVASQWARLYVDDIMSKKTLVSDDVMSAGRSFTSSLAGSGDSIRKGAIKARFLT